MRKATTGRVVPLFGQQDRFCTPAYWFGSADSSIGRC